MNKLLNGAWNLIRPNTEWLVLLAVAGAAAFLYVQLARARADRDAAIHRAELVCAGAGASFAASATIERDAKGRPVTVDHPQGALCRRQVADLAGFRARTIEQSATILADALKDHDARQNTDTAAARSAAEAARSAALRMEAADAEAQRRNEVDHQWFAAVNGVAGLRAPGAGGAGR